MTDSPLVVVEGLRKVYRTGPKEVVALRDVTFSIHPGELVAVRGRSGSGKTTLLNQIGGLDKADAGRVVVDGHEVTAMSENELLTLRRDVVGFVFQSFGLIPVLSAAENVGVPMRLLRTPAVEREARVRMLLALVGLEQHVNQRPYELSGGQRQRVAIARALAVRPVALIADEPVSMLDVSIRLGVLRLLEGLARDSGLALLYITHDIASARYFAEDITVMYAGRLIESGPSEELTQSPRHPYTQLLLESAPDPDRVAAPGGRRHGEPPSLIDPPGGCRFHPRCPVALPVCSTEVPGRTELGEGHWTHCWQAEAALTR